MANPMAWRKYHLIKCLIDKCADARHDSNKFSITSFEIECRLKGESSEVANEEKWKLISRIFHRFFHPENMFFFRRIIHRAGSKKASS
jgi:hypothetical protein